ncbi:MAG TPA: GTPase HflX [Algoriphagus sp.]|jgi:GTP-binding protein HflX|uniref:GTPase HflX n=2 Tax=Algoriphagus TaxID=246875 RepID=UPI000C5B4C74|nr:MULTISPECIES: GTPase HflX [unclassified Algoriphagus]MAL15447.1 GTPase HflX [Algoriphagus sp.]QYH40393.1 GTPase HflX [Algoriphagus sp. NBT04N3]HAD50801.1 GTPase HflX [Algoriphagus sp.]HAH35513.1 GTPase HflX [Algoriphagus sp.]HCB45298.1 GTPase HflX [Algoriphagus sp.]|tara:strand:- start:161 stop:1429 length:1269 start_codon:yes stop_codon:yes gene_type:complete
MSKFSRKLQKLYDTAPKQETAVLVTVVRQNESDQLIEEHLDELAFLTETLGVKAVYRFTQKMEKPDIKTFVGKGKLEEIQSYVEHFAVDMVIFDDDLSPSQMKNLENELKVKVYDRSLLILDIFLQRAQTAQAKTQVELARFQYLLPRLTRMWTHLERQRGGTSTRGGAGEKEIETDKRDIRNKITLLRQKLKEIEKQGVTQRKGRKGIVRVALVGYTNVGKSTLMNLVTKTDILAENKLFATVDSTVRKVVLENIPFLLSDTVGFIRKLPTHLIESFKSTLDEIREADLLVHVVDISHPSFEDHIAVVTQTLREINAGDKPVLLVFNKIDLVETMPSEEKIMEMTEIELQESDFKDFDALSEAYEKKTGIQPVFMAAGSGKNIEEFRERLVSEVKKQHLKIYPHYLEDQVVIWNSEENSSE